MPKKKVPAGKKPITKAELARLIRSLHGSCKPKKGQKGALELLLEERRRDFAREEREFVKKSV